MQQVGYLEHEKGKLSRYFIRYSKDTINHLEEDDLIEISWKQDQWELIRIKKTPKGYYYLERERDEYKYRRILTGTFVRLPAPTPE